ncbi:MAG: septal ring lytic transglycosylase RlpA family protein [Devosia sp.]
MNRQDWIMLALGVAAVLLFGFGLMIAWTAPSVSAGLRCGIASWYGTESGRRTANGERFPTREATAAMPSRSMLGRHVIVRDMRTGRSVRVRINDIGPAKWTGRIIDLSPAAARALGGKGLWRVCLSVVR